LKHEVLAGSMLCVPLHYSSDAGVANALGKHHQTIQQQHSQHAKKQQTDLDCIMASNLTLCMLKCHANPGFYLRPKHTWQEVMVVHVHEALSGRYMHNLQATF